jgi:hypothetical protein
VFGKRAGLNGGISLGGQKTRRHCGRKRFRRRIGSRGSKAPTRRGECVRGSKARTQGREGHGVAVNTLPCRA